MNLVIVNTEIKQDAEGRYCLNDLHRASGGEGKHKPANFIRLDTTTALIEEIDRCSDVSNALNVLQGGINQGTYACKELVYAYAMWISPSFHLQVIRTFDAVATGNTAAIGKVSATITEATKTYKAFHGIARLIGMDKNAASLAANNATRKVTGTDLLSTIDATHILASQQEQVFTPTELGKLIGKTAAQVNLMLSDAGLQEKADKFWLVTAAGKEFARLFDTGKKHGGGVPVMQVKWLRTVLGSIGAKEAA